MSFPFLALLFTLLLTPLCGQVTVSVHQSRQDLRIEEQFSVDYTISYPNSYRPNLFAFFSQIKPPTTLRILSTKRLLEWTKANIATCTKEEAVAIMQWAREGLYEGDAEMSDEQCVSIAGQKSTEATRKALGLNAKQAQELIGRLHEKSK